MTVWSRKDKLMCKWFRMVAKRKPPQDPLHEILEELRKISRMLGFLVPVRITQTFEGEEMADITKNVGQTVNSIPVEKNAEGGNVPIIPANIQYSVDNPSVGQLTQNPDGSASVVGLSAGIVTLTVKDTQFNLENSKVLDFVAVVDNTPTSIDQELS